MRDVMRDRDDVLVGNFLRHLVHGGIVALALATLVAAQRLQKVILALIADAADLVVAGKIGVVTEAAAVFLRGGVALLEFCRFYVCRRSRRRQLGELIGISAQIVVG